VTERDQVAGVPVGDGEAVDGPRSSPLTWWTGAVFGFPRRAWGFPPSGSARAEGSCGGENHHDQARRDVRAHFRENIMSSFVLAARIWIRGRIVAVRQPRLVFGSDMT
jgi:hypothetical protein